MTIHDRDEFHPSLTPPDKVQSRHSDDWADEQMAHLDEDEFPDPYAGLDVGEVFDLLWGTKEQFQAARAKQEGRA